MLFTTRMAVFCTMLAIVLLYGSDQITASKVFVVSSYFNIISHTMTQLFIRGVAETAEVLVSFKRLKNFLELDENESKQICDVTYQNGVNGVKQDKIETHYHAPDHVSVSIKNGTARWKMPKHKDPTQKGTMKSKKNIEIVHELDEQKEPTLSNINVDFPKGKLIGIIGPVGSGKTSFLQALLRELPFESGSVNINGTVSYASQEPWVFAGSVRQNILFGQDYDRDRYDAVVKTCSLVKDFEQFEHGDRTIVGDRGASLSGGQKARLK